MRARWAGRGRVRAGHAPGSLEDGDTRGDYVLETRWRASSCARRRRRTHLPAAAGPPRCGARGRTRHPPGVLPESMADGSRRSIGSARLRFVHGRWARRRLKLGAGDLSTGTRQPDARDGRADGARRSLVGRSLDRRDARARGWRRCRARRQGARRRPRRVGPAGGPDLRRHARRGDGFSLLECDRGGGKVRRDMDRGGARRRSGAATSRHRGRVRGARAVRKHAPRRDGGARGQCGGVGRRSLRGRRRCAGADGCEFGRHAGPGARAALRRSRLQRAAGRRRLADRTVRGRGGDLPRTRVRARDGGPDHRGAHHRERDGRPGRDGRGALRLRDAGGPIARCARIQIRLAAGGRARGLRGVKRDGVAAVSVDDPPRRGSSPQRLAHGRTAGPAPAWPYTASSKLGARRRAD